MNLKPLVDFVKAANEDVGNYRLDKVFLSPAKLQRKKFRIASLPWNSIRFGRKEELQQIPDDKRGVYAFALCEQSKVLPPHGYILYIGIAGRKSKRSLRSRYMDYLSNAKVRKRVKIARMIGTWHEVLRFYFAPVDNSFSGDDLETLELELNTALMPPFSEGDLEAETKMRRRAF